MSPAASYLELPEHTFCRNFVAAGDKGEKFSVTWLVLIGVRQLPARNACLRSGNVVWETGRPATTACLESTAQDVSRHRYGGLFSRFPPSA